MRFLKPVVLISTLVISSQLSYALQVDSLAVEPDTLVAYFSFSGNAADSSGFGNDAVVYGATLTTDRFGQENSAYYFDGDYDYLLIPHHQIYKTEEVTVNFWFKKTTKTIRYAGFEYYIEGLFYKGYDTGIDERNYSIALAKEVEPFDLHFKVGTQNADSVVVVREDTLIYSDIWYQATGVITIDSTFLYINGEKVGASLKGGNLFVDSSPIVLGKESYNSFRYRYFTGVIDDLTMFNYALSDSAIMELYHEGGWEGNKAPDSLIAFYSFDGNADDGSINLNHAEVFGAELTSDRFGNQNSAYSFDGYQDYIQIEDDEVYKTPEKTISIWFRKNSNEIELSSTGNNLESLIYKAWDTDWKREFSIIISRTEPPFNLLFANGDSLEQVFTLARLDYSIEPYKWYHAVGTIDSSGMNSLYLDGKLVSQSPTSGIPVLTEAPIVLGKASYNSRSERYFLGDLDDLRIYNYVLSDDEILKLYHEDGWEGNPIAVDTLLAYLPFDGDAVDSSGYDHDGLVYGAELTIDRKGEPEKAYAFDGINDYIKISNSNSLIVEGGVSFSFWAKGVSQDSLFTGLLSTTNFQPFGIGIDDGDRILFSASYDNYPINLIVEGLTTDEDSWYQYAAVFKGGEYLRLYRDGEEIGTLYGTIPTRMDDFDRDILIGAMERVDGGEIDSLFFKGSIDEVRFYNYSLTDQQVSGIYEHEKPIITGNEIENETPNEIILYQNYPNPFNPSTNIKVELPAKQWVELNVFDMSGRLIQNLVSAPLAAGTHTFNFDATNLASGLYIYQLKTEYSIQTKKLTLIK